MPMLPSSIAVFATSHCCRVRNMTVEEIVNTWNVQLEQDATTFTNEAVKVGFRLQCSPVPCVQCCTYKTYPCAKEVTRTSNQLNSRGVETSIRAVLFNATYHFMRKLMPVLVVCFVTRGRI